MVTTFDQSSGIEKTEEDSDVERGQRRNGCSVSQHSLSEGSPSSDVMESATEIPSGLGIGASFYVERGLRRTVSLISEPSLPISEETPNAVMESATGVSSGFNSEASFLIGKGLRRTVSLVSQLPLPISKDTHIATSLASGIDASSELKDTGVLFHVERELRRIENLLSQLSLPISERTPVFATKTFASDAPSGPQYVEELFHVERALRRTENLLSQLSLPISERTPVFATKSFAPDAPSGPQYVEELFHVKRALRRTENLLSQSSLPISERPPVAATKSSASDVSYGLEDTGASSLLMGSSEKKSEPQLLSSKTPYPNLEVWIRPGIWKEDYVELFVWLPYAHYRRISKYFINLTPPPLRPPLIPHPDFIIRKRLPLWWYILRIIVRWLEPKLRPRPIISF